MGGPGIHGGPAGDVYIVTRVRPHGYFERKGDNLYTCSLLAIDLDTGKMKWYFQFTPHDTHDWDAQSWPVLLDTEINGKPRKVVMHPNRNGFLYTLDRATGEFLRATKMVDKLDWATGIDRNNQRRRATEDSNQNQRREEG